MARDKTCLVTGATGAIGPGLIRALIERGYSVQAFVRSMPPPGLLPEQVTLVQGDMLDQRAVQRAVNGVDVVFHLAAKLHINNPDSALEGEYQRVNVEGTRLLLKSAVGAGVRRFVYFSSICVYGASQPKVVFGEEAVPAPQTIYARTKYEAEKLVLDSAPRQPPIGVVLRLAAVYGPSMKGNYPTLIRALRKGRFWPLGKGTNRRTLVHEQDVVAAALLAAEKPQAAGHLYNVTDGQVHTFNNILAAISQALDRQPPQYHLPAAPVRLLAGMMEDAFHLVHCRSPIGRSTVDKLLEDIAVSGDKIQQELGFRPLFDLEAGWRETVKHWVNGNNQSAFER